MRKSLNCLFTKKPLNSLYSNLSFNFSVKKVRKIDPFGGEEVVKKHPEPNPKRLINKYAIITGGSNGVGKETAELFAASGVSGLTISDIDEKKGVDVVEKLNSDYKRNFAKFVKTDVSKEEDVKRLFTQHMIHHGKLNVLFNNAGVMMNDDNGPVDTSLDVWRKTMEINATSVFLCSKYGIPEILKSGGGSIINVSSIVALVGSANAQIAYTASKGAVLAMTKEMATIYAREGIRINAICPGPLYTELLKYLLDTDEKLDRRLVHLPYGRFGHPKEIAQAATFLASDESSLVNAAEFVVDGGLTKAYLTPL
jgi:NAD(P)-dependent dehydrogenase (short-subunit alcohol dehydrogenase family)